MKKSTIVLLVGVFVINTGYQASGYGEIGLELHGYGGKDGIGLSGGKFIYLPIIGGAYGKGHIELGKHGLELGGEKGLLQGGKGDKGKPTIPGFSEPDLGVTSPDVGISIPNMGLTTPDLGVSIPELGSPTPDLIGVILKDLGITKPSPGVSLPNLGITTPSPGVSLPNLGITTPGPGVSLPNLGITTPSPGVTINLGNASPSEATTKVDEIVTETPSPGPSTPTPETITLETTPAGQTCNQTECEIDCEEKGHLSSFAKCSPDVQTGSCMCGGKACLADTCYDECREDRYQRGYCFAYVSTGRHCFCYGCRQPDCANTCRKGGVPKGFCTDFGKKDDRGNPILKCICYGNKRKEPYPPITVAAPMSSTPDVLTNELVLASTPPSQ